MLMTMYGQDHDVQHLEAIIEILNDKPTIGIRGGMIPESATLDDSSIEFKDVAFRRSSWPIRQAGTKQILYSILQSIHFKFC